MQKIMLGCPQEEAADLMRNSPQQTRIVYRRPLLLRVANDNLKRKQHVADGRLTGDVGMKVRIRALAVELLNCLLQLRRKQLDMRVSARRRIRGDPAQDRFYLEE